MMHTPQAASSAPVSPPRPINDPPAQVAWRFFHEGESALATSHSYDLRQTILSRLPQWPHLCVSLRQSARSITLSSRTPSATSWLVEHIASVMEVIAEIAGRTVMVDPRMLIPGIRFEGQCLYKAPRLIVARARKNVDWAPWQHDQLLDAQTAQIKDMLEQGIASELRQWGLRDEAASLGPITVIDTGRPMPISPANGPRGIARLGVRFVAPWSLDGEIYCGTHTLMGHGLIHRGGQVNSPIDKKEFA